MASHEGLESGFVAPGEKLFDELPVTPVAERLRGRLSGQRLQLSVLAQRHFAHDFQHRFADVAQRALYTEAGCLLLIAYA